MLEYKSQVLKRLIAVLVHVIYPMIVESGVLDEFTGKPIAEMAIDDTTVGRCGKNVAHAGWFRDASELLRTMEQSFTGLTTGLSEQLR